MVAQVLFYLVQVPRMIGAGSPLFGAGLILPWEPVATRIHIWPKHGAGPDSILEPEPGREMPGQAGHDDWESAITGLCGAGQEDLCRR